MHEFSIVQNIIDIVLDSAKKNGATHVRSVEIEVGQSSGVVIEALEFAWEAAGKDTILNNTPLKIRKIPLQIVCRNCQTVFNPEEITDPCPGCGDANLEIVSGKELRVVAIEV